MVTRTKRTGEESNSRRCVVSADMAEEAKTQEHRG